jgi:hypothetical protein
MLDSCIEYYLHGGGLLKTIAAVPESHSIIKILDYLGLSSRAVARTPAQTFNLFEPI